MPHLIQLSETGGNLDIASTNLTFDDNALNFLPDNAQIFSGTYIPTNYSGIENLPAPALQTNTVVALSNFYGADPNGIWSLYVSDDLGLNDQGVNINNGWALKITTTEMEECTFTSV